MKNEFGRRVIEIFEEADRVPNIAVGMLEARYGSEDPCYKNLRPPNIHSRWKTAGLKSISLPEYILNKTLEYSRECKNDPDLIARKINEGPARYIPGHAASRDSIRAVMKKRTKIMPAKKGRAGINFPRSQGLRKYRTEGISANRVDSNYRITGVVPEAILRH